MPKKKKEDIIEEVKTDGVDYQTLNEGIKIGVGLLKIFLAFTIAALIFVCSKLLVDWGVLPFIGRLLKVLSPLFIGLVIAWLFDPIVTKLQKKGVNRVLGTIFVYVIFIFFIYLLCRLMIPSIADQVEDLGKTIPNFVNYLKDNLDSFFKYLNRMGDYDFTDVKISIYDEINNMSDSITVELPSKAMSIAQSIVSGSINLVLGMFIGLYMLFDFDRVNRYLRSLVPSKYRKDTFELFDRLNKNLKSYVQGTFLIMGILFVFQSIALALAGLKAPMVFGLFCAITDIIPYIGPYIGGIPAVLVGFSMSPTTGIFALIAVVVCQCLENYFLQPVVMGKTMKLHPVTIMVGLLVFNYFFGILGMVLATPTISVFKTIFTFFNEKYKFMDRLTSK